LIRRTGRERIKIYMGLVPGNWRGKEQRGMAKGKTAALVILGVWMIASLAFGKDEFAFLPDSGRELLIKVVGQCKTCDGWETLANAKRTEGEWKTYLTSKGALKGTKDSQVKELTSYLAINFPMPKASIPKNPKKPDFIPSGGREILMDHCMDCHLVTLPALSTHKNELGWRQLFTHADHAIVISKMNEIQLKTLAAYLANNCPVPEETVPKELREPAPQY